MLSRRDFLKLLVVSAVAPGLVRVTAREVAPLAKYRISDWNPSVKTAWLDDVLTPFQRDDNVWVMDTGELMKVIQADSYTMIVERNSNGDSNDFAGRSDEGFLDEFVDGYLSGRG